MEKKQKGKRWGRGTQIATTSVRAGLAMTCIFARGAVGDERRGCGQPALRRYYENGCRGGRPCPPGAVYFHGVRRGGALLPTVVPTDSRPLSWPPVGALPRNRLASSATGGALAISPPAGDREGRPYGEVTSSAAKRGVGDAAPYDRLQEVRWGGPMWASAPTKKSSLG